MLDRLLIISLWLVISCHSKIQENGNYESHRVNADQLITKIVELKSQEYDSLFGDYSMIHVSIDEGFFNWIFGLSNDSLMKHRMRLLKYKMNIVDYDSIKVQSSGRPINVFVSKPFFLDSLNSFTLVGIHFIGSSGNIRGGWEEIIFSSYETDQWKIDNPLEYMEY